MPVYCFPNFAQVEKSGPEAVFNCLPVTLILFNDVTGLMVKYCKRIVITIVVYNYVCFAVNCYVK